MDQGCFRIIPSTGEPYPRNPIETLTYSIACCILQKKLGETRFEFRDEAKPGSPIGEFPDKPTKKAFPRGQQGVYIFRAPPGPARGK